MCYLCSHCFGTFRECVKTHRSKLEAVFAESPSLCFWSWPQELGQDLETEESVWLFDFPNLFLVILKMRVDVRPGSFLWKHLLGVLRRLQYGLLMSSLPKHPTLGCFELWIKSLVTQSRAQAGEERSI